MTTVRSTSGRPSDVAAVITRFCASSGLGPGDRLPPERELSSLLDVPRAELRRGLAHLEADDRIIRNVGRGTFLADSNDSSEGVSPREVLEVRRFLEPAIMSLVVRNATRTDLDRIRECLVASEQAPTREEFETWDSALHEAIVASTRNELVIQIYRLISRARSDEVWGNMKRASFSPERRTAYESHHREIVDALTDREAGVAARAAAVHIEQITRNMLGSDTE